MIDEFGNMSRVANGIMFVHRENKDLDPLNFGQALDYPYGQRMLAVWYKNGNILFWEIHRFCALSISNVAINTNYSCKWFTLGREACAERSRGKPKRRGFIRKAIR